MGKESSTSSHWEADEGLKNILILILICIVALVPNMPKK